tara:strand:+ start:4096 stop:4671 length:576 start_codon:yes stop_codon:yes gene_type:complete
MATTLLPFRDYDEHDVINLFAFDGELTKGHMVALDQTANKTWEANNELDHLSMGGLDTNNFAVSSRYGVQSKIVTASGAHAPLGMTLYDVKETDENGEKLVFNPRKAAEMEVALSGQAVPVMTRGVVLYSGTQLSSDNPAAGALLYHDDNGELTTTSGSSQLPVGHALGRTGENGEVLVRIDINGNLAIGR